MVSQSLSEHLEDPSLKGSVVAVEERSRGGGYPPPGPFESDQPICMLTGFQPGFAGFRRPRGSRDMFCDVSDHR